MLGCSSNDRVTCARPRPSVGVLSLVRPRNRPKPPLRVRVRVRACVVRMSCVCVCVCVCVCRVFCAVSGQSKDGEGGTDPLMSPLSAPDALLAKLPPITIGAVLLDPLLDDSVAFAKRLDALGNKVRLHVFPDLSRALLDPDGP